MSVAWQLLTGLPAWEITEIPRVPPASSGTVGTTPHAERGRRAQSLAPASRRGTAVAFGWVREQDRGPVRVIAAGAGLWPGGKSTGPDIPLAYPVGALGRQLPPGGAADAFATLPYWVPVAITPDALLDTTPDGTVPTGDGPTLEDGFLRAWRDSFGWLVLAVPVTGDRRGEMLAKAALDQLQAQRHDAPRAQVAGQRAKARHDEFRQAATTGLWDIWLLVGAESPDAAAAAGALLAASLDLRGLPFGLTEQHHQAGPLSQLLGALPEPPPGKEPGPLTRDVLAMHHDQGRPLTREPLPGSRRGTSAPAFPGTAPGPYPATGSTPAAAGYGATGTGNEPAAGWTPAVPAARPATAGGNSPAADWPDPVPQFPCAASSELLAALAVPPAREVPGVRMMLQPRFDVTPETAVGGPDTVSLGAVLDGTRLPAGTLAVSRGSLNRHTFVCGATGSGKSQTVRHLLENATAAGIPWLVIEPAKAEYRLMAARLPSAEVIAIRPGDPDTVPAGINPLEPATGPDGTRFPLQAHADLVRALFLAAFQAEEPFPQVLAAALTRCYTEAGWDLVSGEPAAPGAGFPDLADLQAAALDVVNEIGYGQEVRDNIRGFVSVRIGSLQAGTTGRFLGGGFPLDYERLLAGNIVLEIEDCGDNTDKAFLTGAILIRLTEHLRMRARAEGPGAPGLRHLTVIEEAHRLLRQPLPGAGAGAAAHAVEMFAGLLAEIRAYGEGLVIAEQIPAKLIPDAIKNTAIKVVHRLPAKDDRDTVGATMNLTDEQSAFLVTLRPGEAAVFTDGMDYPVLAKLPDGTTRERAETARPASPAGLVTSRSPACPPDCTQQTCTLRQVSAAARTAADPRITLWAELTVIAHLTGWAMPMPGPTLVSDLDAMDRRHRDCALAQAADAAVSARIPALAARVSGPALAAHAAAAMRTPLDEERWLCAASEPQWTAPAFVWGRILSDLQRHERDHPGQGPHPSTAAWEAACLAPIPGATCAQQAAIVQQRDAAAHKDPRTVGTVLLGNRHPSAIEHAVGATLDDPAWPDRLATAITVLDNCNWILDMLGTLRQS